MNHEHLVDERPRWSWATAAVVAALCFLSYLTVLTQGGWIWDDPDYITRNAVLRTEDGLRDIWFDTSATPQYYPLVHTSFRFEFQALVGVGAIPEDKIYSTDPGDVPAFLFHLDNVVLFALTALVFWKVLLRLRLRGALLAVLLFAVHPVNVESVAWVTERKNMLSGLFGLLAVLAFLRFARIGDEDEPVAARNLADGGEQAERPRLNWGWFATAFLFWVCGLLSKTVIAFVPPALFLILWWKRPQGFVRWEYLLALAIMLVPGVIAGLHTAHLEKVQVGAGDNLFPEIDGFLDRVLLAGTVVWVYLKHLLLPYQQVFFYEKWNPDPASWWQWLLLVSAVALPIVLWWKRKDWGRGPCVAVLIFGGALVPVMGFANVYPMRFSWVADHFQYHANFALFALIGAGLARIQVRVPRTAGRVAFGGLLAVLAVASNVHGLAFQSPEALWRATVARNPTVSIAWENLGVDLMQQADRLEAEGRSAEAEELRNEAYGYYQEATQWAHDPHLMYSISNWHLRRFTRVQDPADLQQAETYARQGLDEWPNWPSTWQLRRLLGLVHYFRGQPYRAGAVSEFELAWEGLLGERFQASFARRKATSPIGMDIAMKLSDCYLDRGLQLLREDRGADALEMWSRPVEPWQEGASESLHSLFPWSLGDAVNEWYVVEMCRLWMLAAYVDESVRNPAAALEGFARLADGDFAGKQLQQGGATQAHNRWAELFALDMRAAALAALGRWQEAVQTSGQVIMRARQLGNPPPGWVESVERRNQGYRERLAYRFRNVPPLPAQLFD